MKVHNSLLVIEFLDAANSEENDGAEPRLWKCTKFFELHATGIGGLIAAPIIWIACALDAYNIAE